MPDPIVSNATPESQQKALKIGWIPPEQFKGDPDKFIDADQFIERGEQVLPILRKTNEGLHADLRNVREQLNEVTQALSESKEAIKALKDFHTEDTKRQVEAARRSVKEQLVAAKKEGNVEAEVELTSELNRLDKAQDDADAAAAATTKDDVGDGGKPKQKAPIQDPEFQAWHKENSWFGTDFRKTGLAQGIANELRANGDRSQGREFLDKVSAAVDEELNPGTRSRPSKVDTGGSRDGGRPPASSKKRGYADLPKDAKEACDSFSNRLVGANRAYKTLAEWQQSYADTFFEGEQ